MASSGKMSRSQRAGLILPVGRIAKMLKRGHYAPRITAGAPVYLTAVLEYLAFEILDLAASIHSGKVRITPRQIHLAIRGDQELDQLCNDITIREAGVVPRIIVYPGKSAGGGKKASKAQPGPGSGSGPTHFAPDC